MQKISNIHSNLERLQLFIQLSCDGLLFKIYLYIFFFSSFLGVSKVALPHSLPLPRRETLQQSSSLSTVSPATVDLTLKVRRCTGQFKHNLSVKCHQPLFSFLYLFRWSLLVKLGRTPRVLRRILQSLHLHPPSPPVLLHTPPSRQPPCPRFLWLL